LCTAPGILRIIKVKKVVIGCMCNSDNEARNSYRTFVRKPLGKCPLGTPRTRWVDNIKVNLR